MLLDPHLGTIIWTIVTFIVVLVVLKSTVWKPLLSALDEREQRIKDALEGAETARRDAEAVLQEHRQKLEGAEDESRDILRQAREAAEKHQQNSTAQAKADAQQIVEQARKSIEAEKNAALEQLRREVADLAVEAASRIIDANLDDEKNRKLVDELITSIPSAN
jgi:F-type H+-transporting ATPase subunit b